MKTRFLLVYGVAIALAAAASAQTKTSGTLQCGKADPSNAIEVGDHPGHSFVVARTQCNWSKPMDIGGSPGKEGTSVASEEVSGGKSSGGGVHWGTVASGDKYFVRFQGRSTYDKDGKLQTAQGTWKYTGGTGKLKGLTGKGTYKGTGSADGGATYEVEGEYTAPK